MLGSSYIRNKLNYSFISFSNHVII